MENYKKSSLILGFSIWLGATLVFRLAGQYFFLVDQVAILLILYLSVVPVLMTVAHFFFKRFQLTGNQPVLSAALLVLPGMLLDTFVILFFSYALPNMPAHADAEFGSWLMWAYSSVLVYGVVKSK
ncbi:MAG: DUF5367 family protein [Bacteroidota bacterium]